MLERNIGNVKITYNKDTIGWIREVLIDQINVRKTIIQLSKFITFTFIRMRPDYAKANIPDKCKEIFNTILPVSDELYRSDEGC